jgi:DNA replication protein DnaC
VERPAEGRLPGETGDGRRPAALKGRRACAARPSIWRKTVEAFAFGFNPTINRQQIFDLATYRFVERHHAVLIQGRRASAQSRLAQALGHEACRPAGLLASRTGQQAAA